MIDDIPTLEDLGDLSGKTVILRLDINCALDRETGRITEDTRIRRSLLTVRELSKKGARIVIISHQGEPGREFTTLKEHGQIMSKLLGKNIRYVEDLFGLAALDAIKNLQEEEILLLDNLRFFSEETLLYEDRLLRNPELFSKSLLVQKLAPLADAYVNDAFATIHRAHPSTVGFPKVLPSAAGRLMEAEVTAVSRVLKPKRPCIFLLGGVKIKEAFRIMGKILGEKIADKVLTSGLIGLFILKARGVNIGTLTETAFEKEDLERYIPTAQALMRSYGNRIKAPLDVAVDINGRREIDVERLPMEAPIGDIATKTIQSFTKTMRGARTIFVNGPPGIFEKPAFTLGTKKILEAVAESRGFTVIGGGHSIAAIEKFQLKDKFSFISTGGGALIEYVAGGNLPSIEALRNTYTRAHTRR